MLETPPAGDLRVPDDFKLSAGGQAVLGEATGFAGHGSALFASLEGAFSNDLHMPSFVANEGFVTGPHPIVELHVIV